jgi:hypothetical protein
MAQTDHWRTTTAAFDVSVWHTGRIATVSIHTRSWRSKHHVTRTGAQNKITKEPHNDAPAVAIDWSFTPTFALYATLRTNNYYDSTFDLVRFQQEGENWIWCYILTWLHQPSTIISSPSSWWVSVTIAMMKGYTGRIATLFSPEGRCWWWKWIKNIVACNEKIAWQ